MPDPRAVPEDEVRERLVALYVTEGFDPDNASVCAAEVLEGPEGYPLTLEGAGLRWDGTAYLDTEGSQE